MSLDNQGHHHPAQNGPVYTVFSGPYEDINYGFHGINDPPPKYEDVIRGENSVWSNTPTAPPPPQSEPSIQENTKPQRHSNRWIVLATLAFVIIFIYFYLKNNSEP